MAESNDERESFVDHKKKIEDFNFLSGKYLIVAHAIGLITAFGGVFQLGTNSPLLLFTSNAASVFLFGLVMAVLGLQANNQSHIDYMNYYMRRYFNKKIEEDEKNYIERGGRFVIVSSVLYAVSFISLVGGVIYSISSIKGVIAGA